MILLDRFCSGATVTEHRTEMNMTTTTKTATEKQLAALKAIDAAQPAKVGAVVRRDMAERLIAAGWARGTFARRMSGAGGMPNVWHVLDTVTLTRAGAALVLASKVGA